MGPSPPALATRTSESVTPSETPPFERGFRALWLSDDLNRPSARTRALRAAHQLAREPAELRTKTEPVLSRMSGSPIGDWR